MDEKKKVFVIMPFQEDFFEMYEMLKMEFSDKYEFTNAGEEGNQQNILQDIIEPIFYADVVIADLTGLNPNVMYELGVAHTFNKKTIVITKDELSSLPFDLKQYRAKDYSTHFKKFAELIVYLKDNMDGAITGNVSYSNPVNDFMTLSGVERNAWFHDSSIVVVEDTEKGFLDFLADIEENTALLAKDIQQMTKEMATMSDGIESSAMEINRVNMTGGNGTASFVRKKTKKAAEFIDAFATKLREHNKTIEKLWDEVEKNALGLLENSFATHENNKEQLIKFLHSLRSMQDEIAQSNGSVDGLKNAMNDCLGLERSMNQAIRFCIEDLSTYICITQRIALSIDKILGKSRFVVGDIL